jgi:hypothetical protein
LMIMNAYFGLQFPSLRRAADTIWVQPGFNLVDTSSPPDLTIFWEDGNTQGVSETISYNQARNRVVFKPLGILML